MGTHHAHSRLLHRSRALCCLVSFSRRCTTVHSYPHRHPIRVLRAGFQLCRTIRTNSHNNFVGGDVASDSPCYIQPRCQIPVLNKRDSKKSNLHSLLHKFRVRSVFLEIKRPIYAHHIQFPPFTFLVWGCQDSLLNHKYHPVHMVSEGQRAYHELFTYLVITPLHAITPPFMNPSGNPFRTLSQAFNRPSSRPFSSGLLTHLS